MCTKKELVEFLEKFPDDTLIEVVEEYDIGYFSVGTRAVELDLSEFSETYDYYDFVNNDSLKPSSKYYGKRVIVLGNV